MLIDYHPQIEGITTVSYVVFLYYSNTRLNYFVSIIVLIKSQNNYITVYKKDYCYNITVNTLDCDKLWLPIPGADLGSSERG